MIGEVAACLLAGLVALGGWERRQRDLSHAGIAVRIHVNGTRGKSTVTRLIAAALRASGLRTLAKTTGTAARLILPDGSEQAVPRRTTPSIREQLWFFREARRTGAQAVVVECMAIDPALQHVSEREMVRATIGVITNSRPDHGDVMGTDPADVAAALAHTVPSAGILVLGPVSHPAVFEAAARRLGTRVIRAERPTDPPLASPPVPPWHADNLAVALAVTRALNIPDAVAYPAMSSAPEDPGAMSARTCTIAGRTVAMVDASAANDPESLQLLLDGLPGGQRLFVFNHRADRPLRLRQFAASPIWQHPDVSVLVTGDTPDCGTRKIVGLALQAVRLGYAPLPLLARSLKDHLARDTTIATVVLCGNTRGVNLKALVAALTASG